MEFSQFKQVPQVQYYESHYSRSYPYSYSRDSTQLDAEAVAVLFAAALGALIGLAMWGWSMWKLPSKAGYKGASRLLWFMFLAFPLTTGWSLIAFILVQWPVHKELSKARAQQSPKYSADIESELQQLRSNLQQK
jgi:TRAP-type C4-dicarboxylate transport system permease small subunit